MLEKSFGLFFFLKKPKNENADGTRYVYLRITVDGVSKEVSTKRLWHPSRWCTRSGSASGNKEDSKSLNSFLESHISLAYKAKQKLLDGDHDVTSASIKAILTGEWIDHKMVLEVFKLHNDQMEQLIGKDFAKGTHDRYMTSLAHTRSFILWKYGKDDISIKDLDYEFIEDYSFWLKTERKCNQNTTTKYLSNFKKIVLSCVKKKWLKSDPFAEFRYKRTKVRRRPLTFAELKQIERKTFEIERISQVRDIFLFCCYTGLAYIDVKQLNRSEIGTGIDGGKWIFSQRQKTDAVTDIPLLPKALEIIESYRDHPNCLITGRLLPVLSNQRMNSYLKEISDLCGIGGELTTHVARHTFATTVALTNKLPIETVSRILGHASIKQTQHYAVVVDTKLSEDMLELKKQLEKRNAST
jgi:integrase